MALDKWVGIRLRVLAMSVPFALHFFIILTVHVTSNNSTSLFIGILASLNLSLNCCLLNPNNYFPISSQNCMVSPTTNALKLYKFLSCPIGLHSCSFQSWLKRFPGSGIPIDFNLCASTPYKHSRLSLSLTLQTSYTRLLYRGPYLIDFDLWKYKIFPLQVHLSQLLGTHPSFGFWR